MKDLREIVRAYLTETKLMQIATSKDNKPWIATIWYVHDEDLNLYFISRKATRHSIEIKENPNVAGAIVKPHTVGSGEKVRGLQFEGTVEWCFGKILEKARELYYAKYPTAEQVPLEVLQDQNFVAAFYVIHPKAFVLFDNVNFPDNPRQELKL
ncbi:MAG: pyridoxamine 5'-phosphate oxidase family protein [Candidatus Aenigmarchaeota archaeon]|nr:pyridoxamine 5'-phosphate oxidase family protein [Candidatus Aenigmarchaeota archaeon]